MGSVVEWLIAPLQYAFMVRGLLAAVMVGVVCAVVGLTWCCGDGILRRRAGALDSAGRGGGLSRWRRARAAALVGVKRRRLPARHGAISKQTKVREDTATGIIFAGAFALGIALISTARSYTVDLTHFLFGDVLGVSVGDLALIAVFGGVVLLTVAAFYKEFLVLSFDPVFAATMRLPARFFEALLLVLIAVTIVVSLQTVGVALMVAMLVTPAATAYLLTKRMLPMMALAAVIAAVSGVVGLYLSYYVGIASGAAIVLTCTACFGLAWLLQTVRQRG